MSKLAVTWGNCFPWNHTKKMRKVDKVLNDMLSSFSTVRVTCPNASRCWKKEHCYSSLPCCGSNALLFCHAKACPSLTWQRKRPRTFLYYLSFQSSLHSIRYPPFAIRYMPYAIRSSYFPITINFWCILTRCDNWWALNSMPLLFLRSTLSLFRCATRNILENARFAFLIS